jgi:hypothetical protein
MVMMTQKIVFVLWVMSEIKRSAEKIEKKLGKPSAPNTNFLTLLINYILFDYCTVWWKRCY